MECRGDGSRGLIYATAQRQTKLFLRKLSFLTTPKQQPLRVTYLGYHPPRKVVSRLSVCAVIPILKRVVKGKHCIMGRMTSHSISLHWQWHMPGGGGPVLAKESCSLGRTMPERCNDSFDTAWQSYTPYTVILAVRPGRSLRRKVQRSECLLVKECSVWKCKHINSFLSRYLLYAASSTRWGQILLMLKNTDMTSISFFPSCCRALACL